MKYKVTGPHKIGDTLDQPEPPAVIGFIKPIPQEDWGMVDRIQDNVIELADMFAKEGYFPLTVHKKKIQTPGL